MKTDFEEKRIKMVENQLKGRGIKNLDILNAFLKIPREAFVPIEYKGFAYSDRPLPIGDNVTISQPYVVAFMCELLCVDKDSVVLDIGTGSGYQAAILGRICKEVITVEIIKQLSEQSKKRLGTLGYKNVTFIYGDGRLGYLPNAPYDGIVVAAATNEIPKEWKKQLKLNGRILFPKELGFNQVLTEMIKKEDGFKEINHGGVTFVPLVEKRNGRGNRT